MKYLRFDNKTSRSQRVTSDSFCMVRDLWERLIENSKACYRPNQFLTVDEQLLPLKCRCSFLHYMPNKPDKFGIKFWLLVDVFSKYILNGFPYLGKNHDKPNTELQGEYVVKKLIKPYKNKGYCVSSDNFFISYRLVMQLLAVKTTFIGTIKKNIPELPKSVNSKQELHHTSFFENENGVVLRFYQGITDKNVAVLSSFQERVTIHQSHKKKLPNVINDYNKNKVGVHCVDSMARLYSPKAQTRRWPVHVFFNILNIAVINSWVHVIKIKTNITCFSCNKYCCGPCSNEQKTTVLCQKCFKEGKRF